MQLCRDSLAAVSQLLVTQEFEVGLGDARLDDQLAPDAGQPPFVQFGRDQAGTQAEASEAFSLEEPRLGRTEAQEADPGVSSAGVCRHEGSRCKAILLSQRDHSLALGVQHRQ